MNTTATKDDLSDPDETSPRPALPEQSRTRCVFQFNDGTTLLLNDPQLSDEENQALFLGVRAEGRRRLRNGLPDSGFVKLETSNKRLQESCLKDKGARS
jgi:hypothetical protein